MKNKSYPILICILCTLFMVSCKSVQYVPIETIKTEYQDRLLYERDSIYIQNDTQIKTINDTVYIEKMKYEYRNIFIKDTVSLIKVDSIPYPVTVYVDKPVKVVPWYSKLSIYCFAILLAGMLIKIFWNKLKNWLIPMI